MANKCTSVYNMQNNAHYDDNNDNNNKSSALPRKINDRVEFAIIDLLGIDQPIIYLLL